MKKIISLLLIIFLLFSLVSCSEKEKTENKKDAFTPLFRFSVLEGKGQDTKLFYLPESDGFLYLHKNNENGFTGGFVSPSRSLSAEGLVKCEGDLDSVTVWENGKDKAYLLTEKELIFVLLKENGAKATPLTENLSSKGAIPFDPLSFLEEGEKLVLLHPVDLSETYVLADKTALTDFSSLLTVSSTGKKIWYTKKTGETYSGIGFFEYGKNIPLGNVNFPFDSYKILSQDAILFTTLGEENTTYRYLNLETGEEKIYSTPTPFDAVTASVNGNLLCGAKTQGEGALITVINLDSGAVKGTHTIDYGKAAKSLAIDKTASTLLLAFGNETDQILASLDLTRF